MEGKVSLSLLSHFPAAGSITLAYWWVWPHSDPCLCLDVFPWERAEWLDGVQWCCVCGIHMNNFSEGKPCLKDRTNFHSKGSIAFSATLSKRWPHTSLDFRASNNHNPAKPKAMPGWSSVAHEDQECPRGIGLFQPWDYPAGGTYKMSSSSRCSPLNASMSWSI